MPKLVWLNGQMMPMETATAPVADHAHLYGDGIFEGIRIYDRKVFKLDEHLNRLFHGAGYFGYEMTLTHANMVKQVLEVCRQADIDNGYIRINVSRGTGLGLDPKNIDRTPNVMIMVSSLALYHPDAYETGLDVITCSYRVMPADTLDPRLKCIGRYASNIMAKMEANRAGAGEGLMLNHQGYVAECTGDNIFLVHKGVLWTPHPTAGILKGITRDTVLMLAEKEGIPTLETFFTPYDVFTAEEAFLTGTAAEVIPMVSLDNRKINGGKPGEMTRHLIAKFREHTKLGTAW